MSKRNSQAAKNAARERLRQERERQAAPEEPRRAHYATDPAGFFAMEPAVLWIATMSSSSSGTRKTRSNSPSIR